MLSQRPYDSFLFAWLFLAISIFTSNVFILSSLSIQNSTVVDFVSPLLFCRWFQIYMVVIYDNKYDWKQVKILFCNLLILKLRYSPLFLESGQGLHMLCPNSISCGQVNFVTTLNCFQSQNTNYYIFHKLWKILTFYWLLILF